MAYPDEEHAWSLLGADSEMKYYGNFEFYCTVHPLAQETLDISVLVKVSVT